MADGHNSCQKFLLPPCKSMEQAVRHQPYGSTENETFLDKRCRTASQDILWNLYHQVVYRHHISTQRHETAFPILAGTISECWLQGDRHSAELAGWNFMENINPILYFKTKTPSLIKLLSGARNIWKFVASNYLYSCCTECCDWKCCVIQVQTTTFLRYK